MIKILKLVTGEELIGDVTNLNDESILIDKPCALQMIQSRNNPDQPAMALIPYAAYTKGHKVEIFSKYIIWTEEPVTELYNQYNSIFGTGLVVPDSIIT